MRDLLVITPSRGRPDRLRAMLDASLELSTAKTDVAVAFDGDDPQFAAYRAMSAEGRANVAWRTGPRRTVSEWTNRVALAPPNIYRAYASFSDDHMPRTPGWDSLLLEAIDGMGGTGIAYGNDLLQGEIIPTAAVVSTDIVKALGWMALPDCRHYRIDLVWRDLGAGAACLAYVPEVVIEHVHPNNGKAPWDATYAEEAARDTEDDAPYWAWYASRREADVATVAALKGARPHADVG